MVLPQETVLIVGASGRQGCSIANELLKTQKCTVRGMTRDPNKSSCKDLSRRGLQLVQGDLSNPATLKNAFQGVTTAFILTDFWDKSSQVTELDQGINAIEAAANAGVRNIVFSSLTDCEKMSNGRYKVDHFTMKAKIEERIRELRRQNRFESAVFVRPGFYWQNFTTGFIKPAKQADGSYAYLYPVDPARTPVASLDIADFGPVVAKILLNPKQYDGRVINISAEVLTLAQMAQLMSEVSGKRVIAKEITDDEARRAGVSQELIDMFKWFRDYGYYGGEQIDPLCKQFNPQMKDLRTFLRSNDDWHQYLA